VAKKKVIGSKEILAKYHEVRQSLFLFKDVFERRCNKQLHELDKLRDKATMNDSDEGRLSKAMARIVSFKEGVSDSWNDTLKDVSLERK